MGNKHAGDKKSGHKKNGGSNGGSRINDVEAKIAASTAGRLNKRARRTHGRSQGECLPIVTCKSIDTMYAEANPSMKDFAYGTPGLYGHKTSDSHTIILRVVALHEKRLSVHVVDSTVPGITSHDDFYLNHSMLSWGRPPEGVGSRFEWLTSLYEFLRPLVIKIFEENTPPRSISSPKALPQGLRMPQFGHSLPKIVQSETSTQPATNVIEIYPVNKASTLPPGKILSGAEGQYDFSTESDTLILVLKKHPNGDYLTVKKISGHHPFSRSKLLIRGSVIYIAAMEKDYPELYALIHNILAKNGIQVRNVKVKAFIEGARTSKTSA